MYYSIFMHMCVQLLRLFVVFRCVRRYTIVVKSFWWHFYAPNMNIFFVFIHIIFSFFLIKNSSVFLEYFWRSYTTKVSQNKHDWNGNKSSYFGGSERVKWDVKVSKCLIVYSFHGIHRDKTKFEEFYLTK